ncbi:MAG: cyclic nucleotide-binding domain-containing protein [Chloroflexi bacterium]|nr:MAG: cyclic nucleotide-binding domain-containing protein [Chloroflexota bacterium]
MNTRALLVLTDSEPGDSALVRAAREYADANDCSITLLRVVPEVKRAFRNERGALILPWQGMQVMKAAARSDLEQLRDQFLGGRSFPTKMLVRFGDVIDELAAACYAAHPHAVMARSRPRAFLPRRSRDRRLLSRLAAPVLLLNASDGLVGEPASDNATAMPLSFSDKVKALYHLPVFAGMSRKELEMIARNLDEATIDAGTTLIHEGKSNQAFWIVVEGELALAWRGKVVERITRSGLVGVPSMLDGRPAWATVTAVTPVRALVASKEQFRLLRADDRIALRLWAATGARLRHHILESMSEAG